MAYLFLILGLAALIIGGELLVRGAVGIALKLNISTLIVGLTVVSFGTSMPELLVSIQAALEGHPDISMGNVIGSNICNIALVLGLTTIVFPIDVQKNSIRIDWPVMMAASLLLFFFILDGELVQYEGVVFITFLIAFGLLLFKLTKGGTIEESSDEIDITSKKTPLWKTIAFIIVGCVGLVYGADWLIEGAIEIARSFKISERVIGLSLIAFGTSVPELATSVIAAVRRQTDISIGNLIGSNIFNILSILGITSIIKEIAVSEAIIQSDIYWMLGIAFLVLPLMLIKKRIGRLGGTLLLSVYVVYIYTLL